MAALRKLNWRAKRSGIVFTYRFGIGAALVLGLGMCLSMQMIGGGGIRMTGGGIILWILGNLGI